MKSRTVCPYCGNGSGKLDNRGNCISCGGELPEIQREPEQEFDCISGSCARPHNFESRIFQMVYMAQLSGIYTINEIRKMEGLDEN